MGDAAFLKPNSPACLWGIALAAAIPAPPVIACRFYPGAFLSKKLGLKGFETRGVAQSQGFLFKKGYSEAPRRVIFLLTSGGRR